MALRTVVLHVPGAQNIVRRAPVHAARSARDTIQLDAIPVEITVRGNHVAVARHIVPVACSIIVQPRTVAGPVALVPDGPATAAVMNTVTQPVSVHIAHRGNYADTPAVEPHGHPRQQNIPHSVRIRGHMYRAVVLI